MSTCERLKDNKGKEGSTADKHDCAPLLKYFMCTSVGGMYYSKTYARDNGNNPSHILKVMSIE